jgi:hypothetical protein
VETNGGIVMVFVLNAVCGKHIILQQPNHQKKRTILRSESMLDLESQKERFKDHIATFTDYGNIKILDFKKPDSGEYRIRFMFEEDYCRLHITGDLGDLIATNYSNMTYDKFSDFVNNAGYFEEKIDCMSRSVYFYDRDKAVADLKKLIEEHLIADELKEITYNSDIEYAIDDVLENFDENRGISEKGYEIMDKCICDFWEEARYIGRDRTGIIEVYLLAFKLATKQLAERR